MRSAFLILYLLLFSLNTYAQNKGKIEVCASYGMFTNEQFDHLFPRQTREFPDKLTGGIFLTGRYFLSDAIAIGVTAGMDNQQGSISSKSGLVYSWNSFTTGIEFLGAYFVGKRTMVYGNAGIGYTFSNRNYTYSQSAYNYSFNNGVSNLGNPSYNKNKNYPFFQCSPLCFKGGGIVQCSIEIGFGYKGILHTGLLVKL